MPQEIKKIKTLTEFLGILEDCSNKHLLFRGQGQDWPLLPKIARDPNADGKKIIILEQSLLDQLSRRGDPYLSSILKNSSDIELLMVGQHYGLATRLTDWTLNPFVALWFSISAADIYSSGQSVVWIFDLEGEDNAEVTGYLHHDVTSDGFPHTQYFLPNHLDRRITAQKSAFVLHGNGLDRSVPTFKPLEEEKREKLTKIVIPHEFAPGILTSLNRCGVDYASLFPDLEGLCRQINFELLNRSK